MHIDWLIVPKYNLVFTMSSLIILFYLGRKMYFKNDRYKNKNINYLYQNNYI